MQRQTVNVVIALLQNFSVPLQVGRHQGSARSTGNELEGRVDVAHLAGGVLGFQSIFGGAHVADLPGTIHLVPQAPVLHFVGLGKSMFAAEITPLRTLVHIAIFHQGGGFLRRAGAQIQAHQRLGANGFAPGHELIGTKLVGVNRIPRFVEHTGPVLLRANAVEPVVAGYEIAAWIADDRHAQLAYFVDDVFAQPIGVGKL